MIAAFRDRIANLILRWSPHRGEWALHAYEHKPIMSCIGTLRPQGKLLAFQVLADVNANRQTKRTRKRLNRLCPICLESDDDEHRALLAFLRALYNRNAGDAQRMADSLRAANQYGHYYHLIHALLLDHYLLERSRFDRVLSQADRGIDCVHTYVPFNEEFPRIIAAFHADAAHALLMMHRTAEAEERFALAEAAADTPEYLHARALLCALKGDHTGAEAALTALRACSSFRADYAAPHVRMLLEGKHPHFTQQPVDPAHARAWWAWFVKEQEHLLELQLTQGHRAYLKHMWTTFGHLHQAEHDMMGIGILQENGKPTLIFCAYYSRTAQGLIDELLAACPPEIAGRWQINREP